jgi:hypothetical protein
MGVDPNVDKGGKNHDRDDEGPEHGEAYEAAEQGPRALHDVVGDRLPQLREVLWLAAAHDANPHARASSS